MNVMQENIDSVVYYPVVSCMTLWPDTTQYHVLWYGHGDLQCLIACLNCTVIEMP